MPTLRDRRSSSEPGLPSPGATYVYCRPTILDTNGYAYGTVALGETEEDPVSVTRLPSGRWNDLPATVFVRARIDIQGRTVDASEATSGIGTYVGGCVCVARLLPRSGKVWCYGVVVDYTWDKRSATGHLHICFGEETETITFNPDEIQVLAVSTYALRPCVGVPVLAMMAEEMRSKHSAVLDHFTGTGCRATRNSSTILRKAGAEPVDENTRIPLYDITKAAVQSISIRYALDFSYYHGNSRRRPRSTVLGDTIFDERQHVVNAEPTVCGPAIQVAVAGLEPRATGATPPAATAAATTAVTTGYLHGQLSDSDDSDDDGCLPTLPQVSDGNACSEGKRSREEVAAENGDVNSLKMLKRSYSDNPSMLRSIDQLIALKESSMSAGATSDMVGPLVSTSSKSKQQFQPSALQRTIQRQLVTGTYALMEAQLLLETLQVQYLLFAFLLHPAILRALFSWEFGLRGLSIMHFAPVTEAFRRDYAASHDMSDFSRSATLPAAIIPTDLGSIIDALDGLDSVVSRVYLPYVSELVMAARKMVVQLKSQQGFSTHVARKELVHWINERFEQFRGFLALHRLEEAKAICTQFSAADPSFVRVTQIITAASLEEIRQLQQTQQHVNQTASSQHNKNQKGKALPSEERTSVPQAVLNALPKLNGKSLCMRYLSNMPCPSRLDRCFARRRGHFNPGSLPAIVYDFIQETYGGLKKEFTAITREAGET